METEKPKSVRVWVSNTFRARIERAVAARRIAASRPISSKAQAIRKPFQNGWTDKPPDICNPFQIRGTVL